MKTQILLYLFLLVVFSPPMLAQKNNTWHIVANQNDIAPNDYYGITVANGMIGVVEPLKVKDIVLNGIYDTYGRGRVSNILIGTDS